jgi:hypothetical protein
MKIMQPTIRQFFFVSLFFFLTLFVITSSAYAVQSVGGGACRKTGCSGQVCSDQNLSSTCEWRQEYSCYQYATCERQASGQCGWTKTAAFTACLNGNDAAVTPPTPIATPTQIIHDYRKTACNGVCNVNADCQTGFCFQPPMPQCNGDLACPQVMPRKSCRLRTNPTSVTCAEPAPTATPTPIQFPAWFSYVPPQHKNFLELLYVYVFVFRRPSELQHLLSNPNGSLFGNPTPTPIP